MSEGLWGGEEGWWCMSRDRERDGAVGRNAVLPSAESVDPFSPREECINREELVALVQRTRLLVSEKRRAALRNSEEEANVDAGSRRVQFGEKGRDGEKRISANYAARRQVNSQNSREKQRDHFSTVEKKPLKKEGVGALRALNGANSKSMEGSSTRLKALNKEPANPSPEVMQEAADLANLLWEEENSELDDEALQEDVKRLPGKSWGQPWVDEDDLVDNFESSSSDEITPPPSEILNSFLDHQPDLTLDAEQIFETKTSQMLSRCRTIEQTLSRNVHHTLFSSLSGELKHLKEQLRHFSESFSEYSAYVKKYPESKHIENYRFQEGLPVYRCRSEIIDVLKRTHCVIIEASTGAGKSTAIPQYVFELIQNEAQVSSTDRQRHSSVFVVQPRLLAARAVKNRVQKILTGLKFRYRTSLFGSFRASGNSYMARIPENSLFFTSEMFFLNMVRENPLLSGVKAVILDEVHERTILTDVILAFLHDIRNQRPDLYIVVMSATLDSELLTNFLQAPSVKVEGRVYPIDIRSLPPPSELSPESLGRQAAKRVIDVLESLCKENDIYDIWETLTISIKKKKEHEEILRRFFGGILVFLPGRKDCEIAMEELQRFAEDLGILWKMNVDEFGRLQKLSNEDEELLRFELKRNLYLLQPTAIHGGMRPEDQESAIQPPSSFRIVKVVFSTNIAETALTIPNISIVIDFGLVNQAIFDSKRNCELLRLSTISKVSALQRKGRAGRTRSGIYIRCYDESIELSCHVPKIESSSLELFFLKILSLGYDPFTLTLPTPPSPARIESAKKSLSRIGALDLKGHLSSFGQILSNSPLSPSLTALCYDLIKMGFTFAPSVVASVALGSSLVFFGWNAEKRFHSRKARLRMLKRFPTRSESLLLAFAFIDAAMNHFNSTYIGEELSLNNKFVRSCRDTFYSLCACLLPRTKNYVSGFPMSESELASIEPLFKELLIKYFPENIIYLEEVSLIQNKIKLDYKLAGSDDFVYVKWLVYPDLPGTILHYQQLTLIEHDDGSKHRYISEVTDITDLTMNSLDKLRKWTYTSMDPGSLSSQQILKIATSWRNLAELQIFLWNPKFFRTDLSESEIINLIDYRHLLNLKSPIVFIHRTGTDVFFELKKFSFNELLFSTDVGTLAILSDGLRVKELIPLQEDFPICASERIIAPSKIFSGNNEAVLRLPRTEIDLFVNSKHFTRLLSLGCLEAVKKECPFVYRVVIPRQRIDHACIYCFSVDDAERIKSALSVYSDVVSNLRMRIDPKNSIGAIVEGQTILPSECIELVLQEQDCFNYSHLVTGPYPRNRIVKPISLIDKVLEAARTLFPQRKVKRVFEDQNWSVISIEILESEVSIVEESLGAYVIRQYTSIHHVPRKNRSKFLRMLQNRLEKLPKSAWKLQNDQIKLYAYTPASLSHWEKIVKRISSTKPIPEELKHRLLELRPQDLRSIIDSERNKWIIVVDEKKSDIGIIVADQKEYFECIEFLDKISASLALLFRSSIRIPMFVCVALYLTLWIEEPSAINFRSKLAEKCISKFVSLTNALEDPFLLKPNLLTSTIFIASSDQQTCSKIEGYLLHMLSMLDNCNTFESNRNISSGTCFYVCSPDATPCSYKLEKCNHCICVHCLKSFLSFGVKAVSTGEILRIKCPLPECSEDISLLDLRMFISVQTLENICNRGVSKYLVINRDKYYPCPSTGCGRPLIKSDVRIYRKMHVPNVTVECSNCYFKSCSVCGKAAHPNIICAGDAISETIDMQGRKRCPNCMTITEKIEGCNHINCPFCGCHYCWICGFWSETSGSIYEHMKEAHGSFYSA